MPRYVCIHREVLYQPLDCFVEEDDLVEVHGNHFRKPFAGKPTVDGLLNYGVVVDVACLQIYYTSDIVKI